MYAYMFVHLVELCYIDMFLVFFSVPFSRIGEVDDTTMAQAKQNVQAQRSSHFALHTSPSLRSSSALSLSRPTTAAASIIPAQSAAQLAAQQSAAPSAAQSVVLQLPPPMVTLSTLNKTRILLAEDETINQKLIQRWLGQLCDLTIVDNGAEAVVAAEAARSKFQDFDIILMVTTTTTTPTHGPTPGYDARTVA